MAVNATDVRSMTAFRNVVGTFASQGGLPCTDCNMHFREMIGKDGFQPETHMKDNKTLVYLVWKWKNAVNKRLGKEQYPWTKAEQEYLDSGSCNKSCNKAAIEDF